MTATLEDKLSEAFGFSEFREGQREVVERLLRGVSAAAVFPTGGGKSLCYQLPALELPGLTLVVSPLIALMKDQIDALTARNIKAARLDSSLDLEEYISVVNSVRDGSLRLLYVSPERFNNERFRELIMQANVSLFAIDEAHCISEWGHNFRPDYLKLASFIKLCKARCVLALTATATSQVLVDICSSLDIEPENAVRTDFYRDNLTIRTTAVTASERDKYLLNELKSNPTGPTIVYVTLQKTAEDVAARLSKSGLKAHAYHAGMKPEQRTTVQDWFIESVDGIVVATIAFGMGIDKSNIRYVYHYNLPKTLENYSQEIGRSGRDGEPALCHLLACPDDLTVVENFVYGDTPTKRAIDKFVRTIFANDEEFDVSIYEVSFQTDIRMLVLKTLFTYLELDGYLESGTPFYSNYQFKPLRPSAEILKTYEGEPREFLTAMFRQCKKGPTWIRIDLNQAAANLKQPRERLVRALDQLSEAGFVELKVEGVRNRYKILNRPESNHELVASLYDKSLQREDKEIGRIQGMLEWIGLDGCQVSYLSEYFDKGLDAPCGHCSHCLVGEPVELERPPVPKVDKKILADALALKERYSDVIDCAVPLTRVLCGISSPKITRAKLRNDHLYSKLDGVPFPEVRRLVEQALKDVAD
ncbi:MAG: ATP-dependent DNA helicase RecQ [Pirellulaceae bacterium]|jgi:ATP-dependent DNA helicase RecQ